MKLMKVLESSMIALKRTCLNEQLNFDQMILFRNYGTFYNWITEFKLKNMYVSTAILPIYILLHSFIVFTSDDLIFVYIFVHNWF